MRSAGLSSRTGFAGDPTASQPVRELAPAEREGLLESSRRYRANMARFKAGLTPV
ncbi:MAG: hypothetical protein AAF763_18515 [Pseudomonadota bacterium]